MGTARKLDTPTRTFNRTKKGVSEKSLVRLLITAGFSHVVHGTANLAIRVFAFKESPGPTLTSQLGTQVHSVKTISTINDS